MTGLLPALSRRAWTLVAADALSALGNGMITPFLIIYLRDARGMPVEQAALVLSLSAGVGLVAAPATGPLIDRFGPRRVLIAALLVAGTSVLSTSAVDVMWKATVWAGAFGSATAAMWPAAHSLMATVVTQRDRASVFSVHFALLNAGIGVGAVLGGLLVDAHDPASFRLVFVLDAATFFAYALVLRFFVSTTDTTASVEEEDRGAGPWRRLLRDRSFMRLVVLSIVLVSAGYAQLDSSLPAFATGHAGLSTRTIGWVFAVNTSLIVVSQLFVLRSLRGRRRTSALSLVGLLWATCWVVIAAGGTLVGGGASVALFVAAAGLFALGETFLQASLPALVNDLAPDDLRGRYNAANSLTWSIGRMVGPAVGGLFLGAGRGPLFFVLLAAVCMAAAAYALRLRRTLTPEVDRVASQDLPSARDAASAQA